jgi:hypothetical protein
VKALGGFNNLVTQGETKMQVTFKFTNNQEVLTPFGTAGIITMCAVDDGGVKYFVNTAAVGMWLSEDKLTAK